MPKPRILCVCGTRPDAIKMAPLVRELRSFPEAVETLLVSTGQHREMLAQALDAFGVTADRDLEIMSHGQTLAQVTTRVLEGLDKALAEFEPNWVVVQGDTTTTYVAALAAFYRRIPVAHIEAGLRTESIVNPFPEEFNRRVTAMMAALHLAPTQRAAENLYREGYPAESVFVTGNTGIDALMCVEKSSLAWFADHAGPVILVTTHRRENWGEPQVQIGQAVRRLLEKHKDLIAVVPMHKNPAVRDVLRKELISHPRAHLIEPPEYADFVGLMKRATVILTDSGGVQEEAPSFGKPLLVLRETTERPEGVEAGVAKLIGTDPNRIVEEANLLLENDSAYHSMADRPSPYGDGRASERIRHLLLSRLGIESPQDFEWI